MEHRLGDDLQGHENIVPLEVDPRSLEEGLANIGQKERKKRVRGHFRVPHPLRQVNQAAYEPQLLSIGPCHRDKEHLQDMELIKMQYFSRLFNKKGKETMNRCLEAMTNMEEEARDWYTAMSNVGEKARVWYAAMREIAEIALIFNWRGTESISEETAFRLMMLIDGCFIIQLLCNEPQDQFAKLRWSRIALLGDLLLLENQLPFFVLVELYGLIEDPTDGRDFAPKAFAKLVQVLPGSTIGTVPSTIKDTDEINHLLGLVHDNWIPSPQGIQRHEDYMKTEKAKSVVWQRINCATELVDFGIKFMKVDSNHKGDAKSIFDVNFKDGIMKIPEFVIDNNTERLFHNLIAYELFVEGSTYVIDYVILMDNLVNTVNDVRLLRSYGIIQNMLVADEDIAQMLNKLCDCVTSCGDTFFYEETFVKVLAHCERPWNIAKAIIGRYYLKDPMALNNLQISVVSLYVTLFSSFKH